MYLTFIICQQHAQIVADISVMPGKLKISVFLTVFILLNQFQDVSSHKKDYILLSRL